MQIQSFEELKDFLQTLGFEQKENYFLKTYKNVNYEIKIKVDKDAFKKSSIYYNENRETEHEPQPCGKKHIHIRELTTSNFENPENFVVLECVDRLLTLGYSPENIYLEKRWKIGRTAKGGKADIAVYFPPDDSGQRKTFMIIECKTFGYEFEKEKKRLYEDGGQLFSYFQQDKSTKVLVLYTSIFENNEINYDTVIIRADEEKEDLKYFIKQCKEKREKEGKNYPCSFKEASDVSQLVDVWKRVYSQFIFKHGIFEEDSTLYNLDLQPLKKKGLIDLSSSQGLFNSFAEILRHNNISDNANAFNKMMSLFLCKIVDEETKSDDAVLDFQVKFGESYEALVDRLQNLYKIGMEKYLGTKDFVYYSDEDIRRIIDLYPKRTKIEEIEEIFKQIKYYTNNEFAFKEVHNKTLFYQNALILTEIIELIQRYRFKYSHKEQILGNFFELLLNHGVKQSQGQFFTPIPIVRFIVISIGMDRFIEKRLEKLHENDKEIAIPKVIDYACGVAHFLTECIDEINKIIKKHNIQVRMPWEEKFIFGIEKDYRLARTAKIACFLNGDGSANILHGDGLDDHEILKVGEKKFDILLTNPPYSIANFKRYLDVKSQYELLDYLTENSSEIELLFIERAKQIVEEKGRVAIVLPVSILTNNTKVYKKTRELILKYFEIKAIAEFGSKTFIATGTNTVVMFLERRGDWFFEDRRRIADEIFIEKKIKTNDYVDIEKLFNFFIDYRKLPKDEYKSFVFENVLTNALRKHKAFKQYEEAFRSSSDFRNIKKDKNLSDEEKQEKAEEIFKDQVRGIEKEKFLHFSLMFRYGDKYEDKSWYELQKIVIARSPSDNESQKKYLGYEFSTRRGYEGIQILKDENGNPISKLYDDNDYENKTKVAYYIRESFENNLENIEVDSEVEEFVKIYNLPDLFDFERKDLKDFENEINLDVPEKSVNYKFPMMRLGDSSLTLLIDNGQNAPQDKILYQHISFEKLDNIFDIKIGGTPNRNIKEYWQNGNNPWVSVAELNGNIITDT
ncbi:MAG: N-6 DNA methylase, partial [Candidatus Micrarchaeaceae archaeon]